MLAESAEGVGVAGAGGLYGGEAHRGDGGSGVSAIVEV